MIAKIKFILIGLIKGKNYIRYYFFKPYVKWTAGIAILNGSYTIGLYDGITTGLDNIKEISQLPLNKIQIFWLWIYNIGLIQWIKIIPYNIAYYLQLPVNIVFTLLSFVFIFILLYFIFLNWEDDEKVQ